MVIKELRNFLEPLEHAFALAQVKTLDILREAIQ